MVETMPWIGAISFDLGPAPVLKEIQCKDLPVRFAGRAFLCRGRGEPHHRGRDVLRAGRVRPRLGLDDADQLELNGYAGEAIGAEGDLVLLSLIHI